MKKSRNHIFTWLCMIALTVLIFSSCAKKHETEIRVLHRQYMEASMNHDIERLRAMMAEDIVWELGSTTFHGKEEALAAHEYNAGIDNRIEYSNVVVRGDTVEFELVEKNEIAQAVGMDGVRQFLRFVFKDRLVYKKEPWKPSNDMQELSRRRKPFHGWIRRTHSEAMKAFFDSDKKYVYSRENGQLYVQLVRQWQEEKRNDSSEP